MNIESKDAIRILVVGGSGYVGREVVSRLYQELGEGKVVAAARRAAPYAAPGVEVRLLDATSLESLKKGMVGITHVVNCVMGNAEAMIAATRNIAEVALNHGVRRVVHLSSVAVYGELSGSVDENSDVGGGVDWYGAAKLECEQILESARSRGLAVVILRPGLIYGPGSEPWTLRIARLLVTRRLGDLTDHGEGLCNLVNISDVGAATCNALFVPEAQAGVFNLAAPNPVTWNRYLTDLSAALGVPSQFVSGRRLACESRILAIPLRLLELLVKRMGLRYTLPPAITPSLVRLLSHRVVYSSPRAGVLLPSGWISYEKGIRESAEWFRSTIEGRS